MKMKITTTSPMNIDHQMLIWEKN